MAKLTTPFSGKYGKSTAFGSGSSDVHQITGSLWITGSAYLNGAAIGSGGGGTITGGSNAGTGADVFKTVSGANLQFRTLVGDGVTINETTNTIELTASGGGGGSPGGPEESIQRRDGSNLTGSTLLYADSAANTLISSGSLLMDDNEQKLIYDASGIAVLPESEFSLLASSASVSISSEGDIQLQTFLNPTIELTNVSSSLTLDGATLELSNLLGDEVSFITEALTASVFVSASTYYGDGSNLSNLPGGGGSPDGPDRSVQFAMGSPGSQIFTGSSGLLVRYPGSANTQWADLVVSGNVFCERLYGVEDGNGVLTRYQDGLGPFVDVQQEYVILGTTNFGSGPGVDGTLSLGWSTETFASEATASHYHGCFSARTFYNAIDELGGAESGPKDIWAENSNVHRIIYDGDIQLTMTRMTPGASYVLFLSNSVGAAAVTYDPATFKFPGGTVPTNTQVQGAYDIISGISDGARFFCDMTKNFS